MPKCKYSLFDIALLIKSIYVNLGSNFYGTYCYTPQSSLKIFPHPKKNAATFNHPPPFLSHHNHLHLRSTIRKTQKQNQLCPLAESNRGSSHIVLEYECDAVPLSQAGNFELWQLFELAKIESPRLAHVLAGAKI
ncbi:hypothetical protein BKA66DRAFT_127558 [Pyrenochaeta sp. MPI-SDFR-AT-0127]|nr:hypothetical protein BKA66DRAFT_127558 [Pyrenochaeta sp. MPI-SDFR-AT-0127]